MTSKKQLSESAIYDFDPSEFARPGLSEEDVIKIKEIFDIFDYDKSGTISPEELKIAIKTLGME